MEESNYSEAFTKVPNWIADLPGLDIYERGVLLIISRETAGWNRQSAGISISTFSKRLSISPAKVKKTLSSLKEKRLISAKRQYSKKGGDKETRYSLKKLSTRGSDKATGWLPESHRGGSDKATIKRKKEERETAFSKMEAVEALRGNGNIHAKMTETERSYWISRFVEASAREKKAAGGYRVKVRRQIEKGDPATTQELERYILAETIQELEHYKHRRVDGEKIEGIFPYTKNKAIAPKHKLIVQSVDETIRRWRAYETPGELERELAAGKLLENRVISKKEVE